MNAADYKRFKRAEDCECQCDDPICSTIAYRTLSRKPKRNGMVRVERFCDCLNCGPFSYVMEAAPIYVAGLLVRATISKPLRLLGAPTTSPFPQATSEANTMNDLVAPMAELPIIHNPLAKTINQQKVEKFMRLAGQECPSQPTMPDAKTRVLRAKLILEEAFELIEKGLGINIKAPPISLPGPSGPYVIHADQLTLDPIREPDMIELVDGIADLNVVNIGTAISSGVAMAYLQDLVDENNLAKFGPGGYRSDGSDGNPAGKWVKPPGHKPPDIVSAINLQLAPDAE